MRAPETNMERQKHMSKYSISYKYRKPGILSFTGSNATVEAESEATAIRIVEDKHPGYEVHIVSVTKR
jgi:hypothetical protein